MHIAAITGIVVGMGVTQWIPLPRYRLLVGLIALGMFIAGADALVVLGHPHFEISQSIVWKKITCGLLVGFGTGYFIRWFRVVADLWFDGRREKANDKQNAVSDRDKPPV